MSRYRNIPWQQISVEAIAIVVSILLAFWIDAKWQDHLERAEELEILHSIRAELDQNLAAIEQQLDFRAEQQAVIQILFDASDNKLELSSDKFDEHVANLTYWARTGFKTGALDSLIQGGQLGLVSTQELRAVLSSLQREYRWVDDIEKADEQFARNYFDPFLMKNAFFPQIANAITADSPVLVPATTNYAQGPGVDHRELLANREFLGLLVQERYNQEDAIFNLCELALRIHAVANDIDRHIGESSPAREPGRLAGCP
ncbi:MAG: hypothetical protein QNJ00_01615 [Woeseiaceae bacterium]|nr:hypothetical protein [Woeseiaceae bacterium]